QHLSVERRARHQRLARRARGDHPPGDERACARPLGGPHPAQAPEAALMRADIKTVGLLGGGVIGAGWAARCALNGHDVRVCDLDPEAERKLDEVMTNARRAWSRLTLAPLPAAGTLRVVRTIEEAADGTD